MSEAQRTDEIQGEILHVYDDIEEADNNLPVWWLLTFYGAIAFGLVYWFYYHEYGIGKLQSEKYAAAVAAAEAERSVVTDESLRALVDDASAVASGQEIFTAQCVACHDTKGQGREGLGPNLTDRYWIHGGAPTDIHSIITNGVAAKGMPPWAPILGEQGVKEVVAYVLTLRNTDVPGKAPEGELWEPGGAADTASAADAAQTAETE
jgi:cytochrome c oxidase cbb3-type subunit 3